MRRAAILAALLGCDGDIPSFNLNRMIDQPRAETYEATRHFPDGKVMRTPPAGTVPRDARIRGVETTGEKDGRAVERIPIPLTREFLRRGRDRYDIYCAVCHGLTGDGDSEVATNMELRRPPSLVSGHGAHHPPGFVFAAVSRGYGLMPSYARDLAVEDLWAVVAWVETLRRSQSTPLDRLPPELRREAERALGGAP